MSLLQVDGLSKRVGGVVAVDDCSLSVAQGSITGLIGPNGSGKTTVFNLVTGFIPKDSGSVSFKARTIDGLGPDRIYGLGIGRTFQLARIFPRLTALENMLVPVRRRGLRALFSRADWGHEKARAMEMLEFLEIAHVAGLMGGALSYGQRTLSTPARLLRRRSRSVTGALTLSDGSVVELDEKTLLRPLEQALRAFSWGVVAVAIGLVASKIF